MENKVDILLILRMMYNLCFDLYQQTSDPANKDWCEGKLSAYRDCIEVIKGPEFFISNT